MISGPICVNLPNDFVIKLEAILGGYGSGRPGYKRKADHLRSLDVNRLAKCGHLRNGHAGGWQWTQDGERVASIGTRGEQGGLRLIYRITPDGRPSEDIQEFIPIAWKDCHLGGQRPYFICPGVVNGRGCYRQVAKLYMGSRYFHCRHCNRLAYACQSETSLDRLIRKANKRRVKMGGDPGIDNFVRRPKGMHWATYRRHMDVIERADRAADLAITRFIQRKIPGGMGEFFA